MAHYSLLRDYRFANAVDDIRGATLYGSSDEQIGTMDDIVFDHETGDTRYVVVDLGDHKTLVPSGRVYRSSREDGFETDLSKTDALELPVFDEAMLESEKHWTEHEKVHLDAWHKRVERFTREYEKSYSDDPVEHREGSDHFVTPGPSDMPPEPANTERKRVISSADLTPRRIRDKFSGPSHPMSLATTGEASSPMTAWTPRTANASYRDISPRWTTFQASVKSHVDHIRGQCPACSADKAA
jgi:PRC-barrel domain protein